MPLPAVMNCKSPANRVPLLPAEVLVIHAAAQKVCDSFLATMGMVGKAGAHAGRRNDRA